MTFRFQNLTLDHFRCFEHLELPLEDDLTLLFAENGGDWPAIYSEADEFPVAFGVSQVPETWVVDPSGVVQLRLISKVTADQLNAILQQFREQY